MIIRTIGIVLLILCSASVSISQGVVYGLKTGLSIETQQWNNFNRQPLFTYHADFVWESLDEEDRAFSLFTYIGYHVRGSAIRSRTYFYNDPISGSDETFRPATNTFEFKNAVLMLGAKQRFLLSESSVAYYLMGLRGEYTFDTNLDQYSDGNTLFSSLYFPVDEFVQKFTYGISVGGGFEYPFTDNIEGFVELMASPSFRQQYLQPSIPNVRDPLNPGNTTTIRERAIFNLSFEISVGIRFLKRYDYDDEEQLW